jgi:hypothetical protein
MSRPISRRVKMDLAPDRCSVIGMLLDQRDKDFMRERPGLTESRIGTDDDVFVV